MLDLAASDVGATASTRERQSCCPFRPDQPTQTVQADLPAPACDTDRRGPPHSAARPPGQASGPVNWSRSAPQPPAQSHPPSQEPTQPRHEQKRCDLIRVASTLYARPAPERSAQQRALLVLELGDQDRAAQR